MIVIDPVAMGDATCTRPSPKWVWDRTGTLVEVPANTLAVTYDPDDLSKAPYALVEPESKNLLRYSEQLDVANVWGGSNLALDINAALSPNGNMTADRLIAAPFNGAHYRDQEVGGPFSDGELYTFSVFLKADTLERARLDMYYAVGSSGGYQALFNLRDRVVESKGVDVQDAGIQMLPNGWCRCWIVGVVSFAELYPNRLLSRVVLMQSPTTTSWVGTGDEGVFAWGAQLVPGAEPGSYIPTTTAPVTRAADVIGTTAGLLYSNVPMVEPPYNAATTYAKDAAVYDPATKIVYWSMVAGNVGKPLNDPAVWSQRTAINRWAMLDDRNDTQTTNQDDILIVLSARAIAQGLYLGNLDASEIRIAMTDQRRGLVYSEIRNQVVSRSMSSFFRWAFKRLRRKSYFLTLKLPVYANSLVTILIRRPGTTAKCGMCMLGPALDVGLSHYGLSTELRDFSDTSFNPDGTSKTVVRGYAKRMSVDVEVDNQEIDDVEEELLTFRQKVVVYVGTVLFGSAILVGKFSSLKKVIPGLRKSRLSLQVEGVVTK